MSSSISWYRISIILLLVAVASHIPVLISGYPHGHDASYHLKWLYNFSSQLHTGDWYPRWLMGMSGGLGGPSFYYYPPAAYYLMSTIALVIDPYLYGHYVLAYGAVLVAIIGSAGTYLFCKPYLGRRYSFSVALLFLVMPYRILVDLYMRGDLAELSSISVLPFLFLVGVHCKHSIRRIFVVTAATTALIVLTHPLVAMIILPFSTLFRLMDAWQSKQRTSLILAYSIATALGLGLSCFYILPATAVVNPASAGWDLFIVYDSFLFHRPMSTSQLSALLGLASILLAVGLSVFAWGTLAVMGKNKPIALFFLISSVLCTFMLFQISEPIYRVFFILERLQFPWRFATALTFFACIGVGFYYAWVRQAEASKPVRLSILAIRTLFLGLFLMAVTVGAMRHERSFTAAENSQSIDYGLDAPEYRLSELARDLPEKVGKIIGLPETDVSVEIWTENRIRLTGDFSAASQFSLGRQYFGNWTLIDSGDAGAGGQAPVVDNVDGLVHVKVLDSRTVIDLRRQEFSAVILGNRISQVSLILVVIGLLILSFRQRRTGLKRE